jgi:heme A synthase
MIPHLLILAAVLPLQLALGWWNDKSGLFDIGEVGFWGTVIFLVAEMVYLGAVQ